MENAGAFSVIVRPWPSTSQETHDARARAGTTVRGKWRFDTLIGAGGMADVYAATHPSGMRGAIKVLHPHVPFMPEVACTFLRDSHPNAVRVLEDDVDDEGHVCIVMELLEGGTLQECAENEGGKMAPDRVLRIADQVLDGLAALHDAGIVHRDIKPENIFLTTDGRVKIIDFGLAHLGDEDSTFAAATLVGLVMGTPEFMSPEQARGRSDLVSAQSDLWSVGATLFMLLSGEVVHSRPTVPEMLVAIFEGPARTLSAVLPGAHPALLEVVDRALRQTLAERWTDARTMQTAVRAAFLTMYGEPLSVDSSCEDALARGQQPAREVPPEKTPPSVPARSRHRHRERAALKGEGDREAAIPPLSSIELAMAWP